MNKNRKAESVFMAFATGTETKEFNFTRYIGIAPVQVLAVNPTKTELEKIYGREMKEPVYVRDIDRNGTTIKMATVTFIVKTDVVKTGIENIFQVSINLFKELRKNSEGTKVQVMDEYGRTAWVTIEQCKNKEIPVYANGPAKITSNYRPVFTGEEALLDFVKCWLGIPNVDKYNQNTGTWVTHPNPKDCEARFSKPEAFFDNDFTEVKALTSNNFVKVLFGVRTADDGRMFQAAFTDKFAKNNAGNTAIEKALNDRKAAGAYANVVFDTAPLHEYNVEATNFSTPTAEMPASNVEDWF